MDGTLLASWIGGSAQILILDLLLGGDNAIVIALACRILPAREVPRAIFFGTAGAIVLRIFLTTIAGWLTTLPYLELASALILLLIAVNLTVDGGGDQTQPAPQSGQSEESQRRISAAVMVIVLADAIMSLDNIVALAAISRGNFWFLATGLALSIPLLIYGGAVLAGLLKAYPALVTLGGAVLGWTAGDLAATDPAIAAWVRTQAPALLYMLPIAGATYAVVQQWIAAQEPVLASRHVPRATKRRPRPKTVLMRGAASPLATTALQPAVSEELKCAPPPMSRPVMTHKLASVPKGQENEERLVLLGLVGLFVIMGTFIAVVLYLAAGRFHAGG